MPTWNILATGNDELKLDLLVCFQWEGGSSQLLYAWIMDALYPHGSASLIWVIKNKIWTVNVFTLSGTNQELKLHHSHNISYEGLSLEISATLNCVDCWKYFCFKPAAHWSYLLSWLSFWSMKSSWTISHISSYPGMVGWTRLEQKIIIWFHTPKWQSAKHIAPVCGRLYSWSGKLQKNCPFMVVIEWIVVLISY